VADGVIADARFFLEPVDDSDIGIDTAVRSHVRPGPTP
jgi:hypothetical protein